MILSLPSAPPVQNERLSASSIGRARGGLIRQHPTNGEVHWDPDMTGLITDGLDGLDPEFGHAREYLFVKYLQRNPRRMRTRTAVRSRAEGAISYPGRAVLRSRILRVARRTCAGQGQERDCARRTWLSTPSRAAGKAIAMLFPMPIDITRHRTLHRYRYYQEGSSS